MQYAWILWYLNLIIVILRTRKNLNIKFQGYDSIKCLATHPCQNWQSWQKLLKKIKPGKWMNFQLVWLLLLSCFSLSLHRTHIHVKSGNAFHFPVLNSPYATRLLYSRLPTLWIPSHHKATVRNLKVRCLGRFFWVQVCTIFDNRYFSLKDCKGRICLKV